MKMLLVLLLCVMLLFCGCAKVDDGADAVPPITDSAASSETTESENGDISSGEPEHENSAGEENVTTGDSESEDIVGEENNSTEDSEFLDKYHEGVSLVAPSHLYPFVLVPGKEDMFEEAWGTYEQVEGYMYVKNMKTNEIIQLSEEPVIPAFFDTSKYVYCITEGNQLVQVDYTGELWQVLYDAQYGDLADVKYRFEKLFFLDGEYLCLYDLAEKGTVPLRHVPGATRVIACPDGTLLIRNKNKEYFAYNYQTDEFRAVPDEYEVNALISGRTTE